MRRVTSLPLEADGTLRGKEGDRRIDTLIDALVQTMAIEESYFWRYRRRRSRSVSDRADSNIIMNDDQPSYDSVSLDSASGSYS